MTDTTVSKPSVFVFRSPSLPVFNVTRNLLVLFLVPDLDLCAGTLSDPNDSSTDLRQRLDGAFHKLLEHTADDPQPIEVKLFGASHGGEGHLKTTLQWLSEMGLKASAKDVGKLFPRRVTVDISSGVVGVTYGRASGEAGPEILSLGTAKLRGGGSGPRHPVLVFSSNPVEQGLMSQALDEFPHWETLLIQSEKQWASLKAPQFPLAFISSGFGRQAWTLETVRRFPHATFVWVGREMPEWLQGETNVAYLGALEADFQSEFKGAVADLARSLTTGGEAPKLPRLRKAR